MIFRGSASRSALVGFAEHPRAFIFLTTSFVCARSSRLEDLPATPIGLILFSVSDYNDLIA